MGLIRSLRPPSFATPPFLPTEEEEDGTQMPGFGMPTAMPPVPPPPPMASASPVPPPPPAFESRPQRPPALDVQLPELPDAPKSKGVLRTVLGTASKFFMPHEIGDRIIYGEDQMRQQQDYARRMGHADAAAKIAENQAQAEHALAGAEAERARGGYYNAQANAKETPKAEAIGTFGWYDRDGKWHDAATKPPAEPNEYKPGYGYRDKDGKITVPVPATEKATARPSKVIGNKLFEKQDDGTWKEVAEGPVTASPGSFTPLVDAYGNITGFYNPKTDVLKDSPLPDARKSGVSPGEMEKRANGEVMLQGLKRLRELGERHKDVIGFVSGRVEDIKRNVVGEKNPEINEMYQLSDDLADRLLRLRSGAQINEREFERLRKLVPDPRRPYSKFVADLNRFEADLSGVLTARTGRPAGTQAAPQQQSAPKQQPGGIDLKQFWEKPNTNPNPAAPATAGTAQPASQPAPATASTVKPDVAAIRQKITDVAKREGVDPALALVVVQKESNFNPRATGSKGDGGLFQLMPGTAKQLGVTDVYNADQNIEGGIKHLAYLLKKYSGDRAKALMAYNGGEGNVDRGTVSDAAKMYAATALSQLGQGD